MRAAVFFVSLGFGAIALAGVGVAQDVQLPEGQGKDKLMAACTACHGLDQVTSQRRPSAQWASTVDQMIARGAQVTDEDYPVVVEYLSKNFAPPAAGAAAPAGAAPAGHP